MFILEPLSDPKNDRGTVDLTAIVPAVRSINITDHHQLILRLAHSPKLASCTYPARLFHTKLHNIYDNTTAATTLLAPSIDKADGRIRGLKQPQHATPTEA